MFCPHCGKSLPNGTRFCTECGTQIYNTVPTNQQSPETYASSESGQTDWQQPTYGAQGPTPPSTETYESFRSQPHTQATVNQSAYGSSAQYGNVSNAGMGPLDTSRDIVMYVLLSLVTCGIYGFWYIYRMAQDANVLCEGDGQETTGLGLFILLSFVTCGIYSYYWQYQLANRLQTNAPRYGITLQEGGSDVLMWLVLGCVSCGICSFIGTNIILKNMNTLCEAYNRMNGYEFA